MMRPARLILCVAAWLLLTTYHANAQFAGDIFFKEPSVVVEEGGIATMEVLAFVGADALGAAHIEITFDPSATELLSVSNSVAELVDLYEFRIDPGQATVVALNDKSLQSPTGTVSLGIFQFQALAPAGTIVPLSTSIRGLLKPDSTPYASSLAFGGELVVVSPSSSSTVATSAELASTSTALDLSEGALYNRASKMAPPGSVVRLMIPLEVDGAVSATTKDVSIFDPTVPSD